MRRTEVLYGAFELKRSYQGNLCWGIIIGSAIHIGAFLSIPFLASSDAPSIILTDPGYYDPTNLRPLPPIDYDIDPPTNAPTTMPLLNVEGTPVAAPDDEIVAEYITHPLLNSGPGGYDGSEGGPDQHSNSGPLFGGGSGLSDGSGEPSPDVFIAVESEPVRVKHVAPEYPEMARLTGREGKVYIRALVDRDGRVRRAEVAKPSGSNVGFDEAAMDAALKCLYKPAIQNGMPVMVWVTYAVEFKLK